MLTNAFLLGSSSSSPSSGLSSCSSAVVRKVALLSTSLPHLHPATTTKWRPRSTKANPWFSPFNLRVSPNSNTSNNLSKANSFLNSNSSILLRALPLPTNLRKAHTNNRALILLPPHPTLLKTSSTKASRTSDSIPLNSTNSLNIREVSLMARQTTLHLLPLQYLLLLSTTEVS